VKAWVRRHLNVWNGAPVSAVSTTHDATERIELLDVGRNGSGHLVADLVINDRDIGYVVVYTDDDYERLRELL
jgi:hypothetical protein